MFKKILSNTAAKKACIFATVFTLTGVLMGSALMGSSDSAFCRPVFASASTESQQLWFAQESDLQEVWQPESGTYSDFTLLVQSVNGTGSESEDITHLLALPEQEEEAEETGFVYCESIPLDEDLQRFTYERCEQLGIEYELVLALMWRESRFQVGAVGYNTNGTRDSGIMQINDVNRGWLREQHGITDLMDPYQNITAGTLMFSEFIHEYGDENSALMAYHYGKAGMQRKVAQGITTNKQVSIALDRRDYYKDLMSV